MKQQANTEFEDKLKHYKRGQSMGDIKTTVKSKKKHTDVVPPL